MVDFKNEEYKEKFIEFKDRTLNRLNETINKKIETDYKKSVLLTYWLKDYNNFLKQELTYKPNYQPSLKQGSIVQVNLGFRLGNEQGGLHYAIVLDKNDNKRKPIITVIPLSSIKEGKKLHKTHVNLGTEVYNLIDIKTKQIIDSANNQINELSKLIKNKENDVKLEELIDKQNENIKYAIDCIKKTKNLKKGSYAICEQIITISKMRVYDPITTKDPLYNLIISEESMEKIKKIIKQNYI